MFGRNSPLFDLVLVTCDIGVAVGAWVLAYVVRFHSGLFVVTDIPPLQDYVMAFPPLLLIALLTYRATGLYHPRRTGAYGAELSAILRANLVIFIGASALTLYANRVDLSRIQLAVFPVVNAVGSAATRLSGRVLMRALRRGGRNQRRAVVVGDSPIGDRLVERFRDNPWTGIAVCGFLSADASRVSAGERKVGDQAFPVLGGPAQLPEVIREHRVDQVYVAMDWDEFGQLAEIVGALDFEVVDLRVVPDLSSFSLLNPRAEDFDGLPLLSLRQSRLTGWSVVGKRLVDVAVSVAMLLLMALPMLLIALLIKLTSRGPVFYSQERVGLDGRPFSIFKFRSMRVDAEQATGAVMASPDDPRKTWFGSFLRRTSLDELPQFFNALIGSMSVVGPRPERPELIEDLKTRIPDYMLRHKMKAGITGLAQIRGLRGGADGEEGLRRRIEADIEYIERWSLWLDLRIMLATPGAVLTGKGAF